MCTCMCGTGVSLNARHSALLAQSWLNPRLGQSSCPQTQNWKIKHRLFTLSIWTVSLHCLFDTVHIVVFFFFQYCSRRHVDTVFLKLQLCGTIHLVTFTLNIMSLWHSTYCPIRILLPGLFEPVNSSLWQCNLVSVSQHTLSLSHRSFYLVLLASHYPQPIGLQYPLPYR